MVDSPYNGLNFCCGTAAEGLTDPKSELIPIVKYFAERKKIFNIHFRNIVGGLRNFSEVSVACVYRVDWHPVKTWHLRTCHAG
jgi:mannonate dehydratase